MKWQTTYVVEKNSEAKFNDGRLKVSFKKTKKMHKAVLKVLNTKKMHPNLYLVGRSAHIPSVKGYYCQIGKEKWKKNL
ncbi:hypothetical protein [Flavobacterium sp. HJJ]|uniref:hypothetical protein n=1 Tax=Flavobacterium sp. HJJ TaxID=2783792 RepID=UPI00188C77F1|nr:hypothetical protein [Flavobacterium sp. HJJ]MBF4473682.1 hypothetical protein [Flavobacterium sp. HJJ]